MARLLLAIAASLIAASVPAFARACPAITADILGFGDLGEDMGLVPIAMPSGTAVPDDSELALCLASHQLQLATQRGPADPPACRMRVRMIESVEPEASPSDREL